jgi:hypothetical protein
MADLINFSALPPLKTEAISTTEKSPNPTVSVERKHIDLTKGALDFQLSIVDIEYADALKRMIQISVKEQQAGDGRLKSLSKLQNVLQKFEQAEFSEKDLYKTLDFPMSDSEKQRVMASVMQQAEVQRDSDIKRAWDAESAECEKIQAWEMTKISGFSDAYSRMKSIITPEYKTAGENGNLYYWGL